MKYINNDFDVNKSMVDEIDGTFFYTERLKVRSMRMTDLPDFYFYRSNPEVAKYDGFERYNAEQANEFIIEQVENRFLQHGEWVQFGIENRETERLIGDCAVMLNENCNRMAEVEITISHKEQRKGYGKEALVSLLEFLNLREDAHYSENDLEKAIIDKLEQFMLELGKGFLFESRQKKITLDGDHYYIDLSYYNRLLKCFVLIDLKIGKLTHQDIGQMQMYVNYHDRKLKSEDENPTIGIILCKQESKAVVEFTLPENNEQIFAREYKLYLPSKEELKKQLVL
jgi:predicted nuclease of restriction endonuclease-like (RecB) superfamily